jgi:uncharacterized membrane protein
MMQLKITKPLWQVLGIGVLAGMRTSSAPVVASHILSHKKHSKKLAKAGLNFMQSDTVATTLKVLALGELIADKLPSTGNRISPVGIIFRGASGAFAGASIFKATGGNATVGAIIGGSAAVAATFGSFFLRKATVSKSGIVDPIIGAIEDALVIGAGVGLAIA